jgi:hypothetical protein
MNSIEQSLLEIVTYDDLIVNAVVFLSITEV